MTKQRNILTDWLEARTRKLNDEGQAEAKANNEAPCEICGCPFHVNKYRKVEGQVRGETHGSFDPWFGGSVSGWVEGETDTKPVNACRNCGNERLIVEHDWILERELFWEDMHDFYFFIKEPHSKFYASEIEDFKKLPYINKPVETRQFMLDNDNWEYSFYNAMRHWSVETWAKAGFKFEMVPEKVTEYKLFGRWTIKRTVIPERYPTWRELMPSKVEEEQDEDEDW